MNHKNDRRSENICFKSKDITITIRIRETTIQGNILIELALSCGTHLCTWQNANVSLFGNPKHAFACMGPWAWTCHPLYLISVAHLFRLGVKKEIGLFQVGLSCPRLGSSVGRVSERSQFGATLLTWERGFDSRERPSFLLLLRFGIGVRKKS